MWKKISVPERRWIETIFSQAMMISGVDTDVPWPRGSEHAKRVGIDLSVAPMG